jgi:NAD(P)-dependent dehydrogenase (short-subunit alcohol dehydrogenase family)
MIVGEIKEEHPGSKGSLEIGVVDTADLDSVRSFAQEFLRTHNKLHYLVNNAGIHYLSSDNALKTLSQFNPDHVSKQGELPLPLPSYRKVFIVDA